MTEPAWLLPDAVDGRGKARPRSFSIAVDAIANDGKVELALQMASDKLGTQSNESVYASYAYRIRTDEDGAARLAFGISGGLVQLGINGAFTTQILSWICRAVTSARSFPTPGAGVFTMRLCT